MVKQIEDVLRDLDRKLNKSLDTISFASGEPGRLLFKILYSHYLDLPNNTTISYDLQRLAEAYLKANSPTFCNGKAGVFLFYKHLFNEKRILKKKDIAFLNSGKVYLERIALNYISHGYHDFLHGGIGIAYSLLLYEGNYNLRFWESIFANIINLFDKENGTIPDWDYLTQQLAPSKVNLGISHGIISILKLALTAYKKNICSDKAKFVAFKIRDFLLSHSNKDKTVSYFPNIINFKENQNDGDSRLGWCYGDLMIGYVLKQFSELFDDIETAIFSEQLLMNSTLRRGVNNSRTFIKDAGICHGTAGVAHIYNRLYHKSYNPIYKESRDYWISETLKFLHSNKGPIEYKKFRGAGVKHDNNNSGFLEGIAGIGLVLLSYLTSNVKWDYFLMLNDIDN